MEYRLYRVYPDGVRRVREKPFESLAWAATVSRALPMDSSQTGWGVAWGYPESAILSIDEERARLRGRPCCGGITYHFDGCPEDGRTA